MAAITAYLEVDGLTYLPLAAWLSAAGPLQDWERSSFGDYLGPRVEDIQRQLRSNPTQSYCGACFSGQYPLFVPDPNRDLTRP